MALNTHLFLNKISLWTDYLFMANLAQRCDGIIFQIQKKLEKCKSSAPTTVFSTLYRNKKSPEKNRKPFLQLLRKKLRELNVTNIQTLKRWENLKSQTARRKEDSNWRKILQFTTSSPKKYPKCKQSGRKWCDEWSLSQFKRRYVYRSGKNQRNKFSLKFKSRED